MRETGQGSDPVVDMPAGRRLELRGTYAGRPTLIGYDRNGGVTSGIRKLRVTAPTVEVGWLNIEGDGQADLRVHGGIDKAMYCYPADHLPFWQDRVPMPEGVAPFGENLSVRGVDESTVCIGDRWRWGNAILEVSQPRWPCYKLAIHTDRPSIIKEFVAAARSGWYLRVLKVGAAPTSGDIEIEYRDPQRIPVAWAFAAARGDLPANQLGRVNDHPALADAWRR